MTSFRIFFTLLTSLAFGGSVSARSIPDRCAELIAERAVIQRDADGAAETENWLAEGQMTATGRVEALEGSSGLPIIGVLLSEEAYKANGMLRFRERYALPIELAGVATAVRPAEFWRLATIELRRMSKREADRVDGLIVRLNQNREMLNSLNCPSEPPETSGPLSVDRRADGQPIITDALITRWIKVRYALANTGGAYWQAGRMTQQDYVDVDRRMQLYLDLKYSRRTAEQFSDDETRAVNSRWTDIDNTIQGLWSRIQFQ